jgi:hypothetical protein
MRIGEAVVRKPENITYREMDGEGVLYDTATNNMHVLNKTALMVWKLCEQADDPESIAHTIGERFGLPAQRVLPDVLTCLNRLEELRLIRRVAA